MTLVQAFLNTVQQYPNNVAIFFYEQKITYKDLSVAANNFATGLHTKYRVKPGDRVAIYCKNRPEFLIALLGALIAGAIVVPINSFLKPEEISYILTDSDARVLVSEKALLENTFYTHQMVSGLRSILVEDFDKLQHNFRGKNTGKTARVPGYTLRTETDIAVISYTSGTTGKPKGAMLTHKSIIANAESCRVALSVHPGMRFALPLPMFHSFMLTLNQWVPLLNAGAIILIRSIQPFRALVAELIEKKPDILAAVPVLFRALLDDAVPSNLPVKLGITGAAPLSPDVAKAIKEKFQFPMLEGYGLTEASPVVAFTPMNGLQKAGSVGLPLQNIQVSIQDDQGNMLKSNQTGEICVKGENVMAGYWNMPEATAETIRNGWLLTGDMGHIDEDGYIFITDRKKDMLLVNGNNVYPREIEDLIIEYPGIHEVAVIGQPDPIRGERPVVFYAVKPGATIDEMALRIYLKSKLANYKLPRIFHRIGALPRNDMNKVLKSELRKFQLD